ncbi:MAG: hypothetical protein ACI4MF_06605 [Candidatus Faecivicinus sp.]
MGLKRKLAVVLVAAALLFLLTFRIYGMDDGGSVQYWTPLVSVTRYHRLDPEHEGEYLEGWCVEILGTQVYERIE